jgi:hypothetical protein
MELQVYNNIELLENKTKPSDESFSNSLMSEIEEALLLKDDELEEDEIYFYIDTFETLGVDFSKETFTKEEYDKIDTEYINRRHSLNIPYSSCCRPSIEGRFERFCKYMDVILSVIYSRVREENL